MRKIIAEKIKEDGIVYVCDGFGFEDIRLNSSIKANIKFELEIDDEESTKVYVGKFVYSHENRFIVDGMSRYRYKGQVDKLMTIKLTEADILKNICRQVNLKMWHVTSDEEILDRLDYLIEKGDYTIHVIIEDVEIREQEGLYEECRKVIKYCSCDELKYEFDLIEYLLKVVENEEDKRELYELYEEAKYYVSCLTSHRIKDADCIRRSGEYLIFSKVGRYFEDEDMYRCVVIRNNDMELKELRGEDIETKSIADLIGIESFKDFGKLVVMEKIEK